LLTTEEAENSPVKNVIVQALGASIDIVPVIWSEALTLVDGDVLIPCTDGLCGLVDATRSSPISPTAWRHTRRVRHSSRRRSQPEDITTSLLACFVSRLIASWLGAEQTTRRLPCFDSIREADEEQSMPHLLMVAPDEVGRHG
jgi:hypothetical protein